MFLLTTGGCPHRSLFLRCEEVARETKVSGLSEGKFAGQIEKRMKKELDGG